MVYVVIALSLCVALLAIEVVDHRYQLRTLHNYAREWGTPLGKRGPCRGPATVRRIK